MNTSNALLLLDRSCPHCRQPFKTDVVEKRYCSERCRRRHHEAARKARAKKRDWEKDPRDRTCQFCGAVFRPKKHKTARFCTATCYAKARYQTEKKRLSSLGLMKRVRVGLNTILPRPCDYCYGVFTPKHWDANYCSDRCSSRADYVNHREAYNAREIDRYFARRQAANLLRLAKLRQLLNTP